MFQTSTTSADTKNWVDILDAGTWLLWRNSWIPHAIRKQTKVHVAAFTYISRDAFALAARQHRDFAQVRTCASCNTHFPSPLIAMRTALHCNAYCPARMQYGLPAWFMQSIFRIFAGHFRIFSGYYTWYFQGIFRAFSGYFQGIVHGVFRVFSGIFRVFSGYCTWCFQGVFRAFAGHSQGEIYTIPPPLPSDDMLMVQ